MSLELSGAGVLAPRLASKAVIDFHLVVQLIKDQDKVLVSVLMVIEWIEVLNSRGVFSHVFCV